MPPHNPCKTPKLLMSGLWQHDRQAMPESELPGQENPLCPGGRGSLRVALTDSVASPVYFYPGFQKDRKARYWGSRRGPKRETDLTSLLNFFFSRAWSTQVSSAPKEGSLVWECSSWAQGAALLYFWAMRGGMTFWALAHILGEAERRPATDQSSGQPSMSAPVPRAAE